MNVLSKEVTEEKENKKQLLILPDEIFFTILDCIDFPFLCRIKPVCKWWMATIENVINARKGNKPFTTNAELRQRVREYCYEDKKRYADKLLRIYGWPINKWDVSKVTDFSCVFHYLFEFNEYIGDWDVSNGTMFNGMFHGAVSFNQDIGNWNISKAINLSFMFSMAGLFHEDPTTGSFNQDLSRWNTSKVTNMRGMFSEASSFNGDLSTWNTGNVSDMESMFRNASMFNQNISYWNTSSVRNMGLMFCGATSFCQNISSWDVRNVQRVSRALFHDGVTSLNDNPNFVPRFND
mmetsp:Transcript_2226/g.3211  ORF Transcript_2226/g.3211 Transcript_2226/m.3211 type:complete len:293 (+) Transcript_2226:113-991(+)